MAGKLTACGTIEELAEQTREDDRFVTEIRIAGGDDGLVQILRGVDGVLSVGREDSRYIIGSERDITDALVDAVRENGYSIVSLRPLGNDLDEIYRRYFEKSGGEKDEDRTGKFKTIFRKNR